MIYIDSETMNVNINGDIITYNPNTLEIIDGPTDYDDCIYLDFGDDIVFILDEINESVKYPSDGYKVLVVMLFKIVNHYHL